MTYYYLFIILFMVIAFLADAIKKGELARFGKATAVCVVGALIGISLNLSNLYHTWQYGQETMRGKSELVKKNAANQTSSGLDRDYITQWSYGIDETWTLMIPDAKGGASVFRWRRTSRLWRRRILTSFRFTSSWDSTGATSRERADRYM